MPRYDLIVVGSGPAGHHAAIQAAKLGRKAAIVERQRSVGSACIDTGTIPSKTLREASCICPAPARAASTVTPTR